jgi:hypothetical protein
LEAQNRNISDTGSAAGRAVRMARDWLVLGVLPSERGQRDPLVAHANRAAARRTWLNAPAAATTTARFVLPSVTIDRWRLRRRHAADEGSSSAALLTTERTRQADLLFIGPQSPAANRSACDTARLAHLWFEHASVWECV